jgi:predicted ester cyclase
MDANVNGSKRLIEEVFGGGNYRLADELIAAGAVAHDAAQPAPIVGPEGAKESARGYRSAFPDLSFTIDQTVAEGEYVACRWTSRGTHKGELFGIAATGKEATVTGISIDRWQNGKIVESWVNWDTLGLLQQIGAVPAAVPTA